TPPVSPRAGAAAAPAIADAPAARCAACGRYPGQDADRPGRRASRPRHPAAARASPRRTPRKSLRPRALRAAFPWPRSPPPWLLERSLVRRARNTEPRMVLWFYSKQPQLVALLLRRLGAAGVDGLRRVVFEADLGVGVLE